MTDTEILLKILEKVEAIEKRLNATQKCQHRLAYALSKFPSNCPDCKEQISSSGYWV